MAETQNHKLTHEMEDISHISIFRINKATKLYLDHFLIIFLFLHFHGSLIILIPSLCFSVVMIKTQITDVQYSEVDTYSYVFSAQYMFVHHAFSLLFSTENFPSCFISFLDYLGVDWICCHILQISVCFLLFSRLILLQEQNNHEFL